MGKTHNDREYEKGVNEGKSGSFIEDLIQKIPPNDSPRDKGYEFGRKHRYEYSGGGDDEDNVCPGCGCPSEGGVYCDDCEEEDEEEEKRRKKLTQKRKASPIIQSPLSRTELRLKEFLKKEEALKGSRGILHLKSKYDREVVYPFIIEKHEISYYSDIIFDPVRFELTYKCNLCGNEWVVIRTKPFEQFLDCHLGCSIGLRPIHDPFGWLFKIIMVLITKKPQFGRGELIGTKEI